MTSPLRLRLSPIYFSIFSLAAIAGIASLDLKNRLGSGTGQRIANAVFAAIVLMHGLLILQMMWRTERIRGKGTIPFVWSYFGVQHLTFGFGGFLASTFDFGYYYSNVQGIFPWEDVIIPTLLVHSLSMTVGLLTLVLSMRPRSWVSTQRDISGRFLPSWKDYKVICLVSLAIHAVVWGAVSLIRSTGAVMYVIAAISYCANASFVLWGMCWKDCRQKLLFASYLVVFVLLETVEGNRTFFVVPLVLFAIGLVLAGEANRRTLKILLKASPAVLLLMWIFVRSEDIRNQFHRSVVADAGDAVTRVEALTDDNSANGPKDATGVDLNDAFRVGSRLFELSAGDVITRTPSAVPYWGWSDDDTSVLLTSLLPLKLNPDAALFSSDTAGVLFLRTYGWQVEPLEGGSSMPSTLIADGWRRFAWLGVAAIFVGWTWLLARATIFLRFRPNQVAKALFASSVLANVILQYTADAVTLFDSIPRRLIVVGVYVGLVMFCGGFASVRESFGIRSGPRSFAEVGRS